MPDMKKLLDKLECLEEGYCGLFENFRNTIKPNKKQKNPRINWRILSDPESQKLLNKLEKIAESPRSMISEKIYRFFNKAGKIILGVRRYNKIASYLRYQKINKLRKDIGAHLLKNCLTTTNQHIPPMENKNDLHCLIADYMNERNRRKKLAIKKIICKKLETQKHAKRRK